MQLDRNNNKNYTPNKIYKQKLAESQKQPHTFKDIQKHTSTHIHTNITHKKSISQKFR